MPRSGKLVVVVLVVLLSVSSMLIACGGNGDDNGTGPPPPPPPSKEPKVITIGNLSDLTGPSANAQLIINAALDDLIKYYDEENLIPGVEIKVETYDGQLDPAKDIPGYEWLRDKGADFIISGVPATPVTLKTRADRDKFVVIGLSGDLKALEPPGYVFGAATYPEHEALTLLPWIAENDWDYQTNGPAKIGGAAWNDGYSGWFFQAIEDYADAHPDQFEWIGGNLTNFSFTWGPEVEMMKDADYIFPCSVMASYVREYREAGHDGKLIGADVHAAFFGLIDSADLWDEIDGMLFIRSSRWWNEEGEIIDLTKELLNKNRAGEAEEIMRGGVGYISILNLYEVLEIVRQAVETVGPENFDTQAFYDAAQNFSLVIEDVERASFTETKRYSTNYYAIYEANGDEKNIFRIDPEWYYHQVEP